MLKYSCFTLEDEFLSNVEGHLTKLNFTRNDVYYKAHSVNLYCIYKLRFLNILVILISCFSSLHIYSISLSSSSIILLKLLSGLPTSILKWFPKIWVDYYREISRRPYSSTSCFLLFLPNIPSHFDIFSNLVYPSVSGSSSWSFSLHVV